ncbi:MAG: radical SAM protein [Hyphomicrobiaceae bacterium]|nr:radical SAM protein [Hyphomicrobiaceae bacterium]
MKEVDLDTIGISGHAQQRGKFEDPDVTAKGEHRASVPLVRLETLWLNTGSLCNIACRNCYIESSPANDKLVYLTAAEAAAFFDEAQALGTREIGFTGGEPFLNPDVLTMLEDSLRRGFETIVLTNAMRPMRRRAIAEGLIALRARHGNRLLMRVSLDHYTQAMHEEERGPNTWQPTIDGLNWLVAKGFPTAIAGRTCWGESESDARIGYGRLFADRGWPIDAQDRAQLVLFPEMDVSAPVPEITTACWGILGKAPSDIMCATSRMVVKRKGADKPVVLPCTLLPYELAFEMGSTLSEAAAADGGMFDKGAVKLCHPHCAKFCVLGGASCS